MTASRARLNLSRVTYVRLRSLPVLAGAVALLAACGGGADLEGVADSCSAKGAPLSTSDGGDTLIVTSANMSGSGVSSTTSELANTAGLCVLDALEVPDSVTTKVSETRGVDGRQDEAIDGFDLSWTYNPDDGLSLIVVKS